MGLSLKNLNKIKMSNYTLIKQAISNRSCITGRYNGYTRRMTPHVLGTKKW